MADPEQLSIIRQGTETWNKWRKQNPDIKINLSGANLSEAHLSNTNLSKANLSGAYLSEAHLPGANLYKADLYKANLSKADLSKADLSKANLSKADLSKADLNFANLSRAKLSRAKLLGAFLSGAKLSRAFLSEANLYKANLPGANLSKANLYKANLSEAFLSGANLYKADLSEAFLYKANLYKADLSEAFPYKTDLSEADLHKANLSGADLLYTNLSKADLSEANLSGADLLATQALDTNFDNANLTGACIENWNISNETNLNNVSCDYIFLKGEWNNKTEKYDFSERRPSHPNKNFQPGEFTTLSQKALETIDLIFLDGIDWTTFLTTFQKLQIEDNSSELSIQAIEKKQDGTFVIRVNTPTNTNKETIKTSFWSKYQPLLEAKNEKIKLLSQKTEFYSQQIQFIRQDNTRLLEIIKTMTEKEASKINMTFNIPITGTDRNIEDNQNIYTSEQKLTLAEAVAEIQKLLKQLEQTNPTATKEEAKL